MSKNLSLFFSLVVFTFGLLITAPASAQITVRGLLKDVVADPDNAKFKNIGNAISKFQANDVESALNLLKDACKQHAQLPPAHTLLAKMYYTLGNAAAGNAVLEKSTVEAPTDPEAYLIYGDLAFQQQHFTASLLLFEKAHQLIDSYDKNPMRKEKLLARAIAGLAAVSEARGQWDQASAHLQEWIKLDPASQSAMTRLGRAQFLAGKVKEAYTTFQEMYKLDEKAVRPEINMALLYEQKAKEGESEKHQNAVQLMNFAAERDSQNISTRLTIAQWAVESCELEMGKSNAEAAIAIDDRNVQGYLLAGLVARYQNQLDVAEQHFRKARALSPSNFAAMNQLAIVLIEKKDDESKQEALEYAQMNVRLNNDLRNQIGREAAVTLGWILHRLDRNKEAGQVVGKVVQNGSVSANGGYYLAKILVTLENKPTAIQVLQGTINNNACFVTRKQAQDLLTDLLKK